MTEQLTVSNKNLQAFMNALQQIQGLYPHMDVKKQHDNTLPFEGEEDWTQIFLEFKEPRALFYLGRFFEKNLQQK